jgi:hypothetical protein
MADPRKSCECHSRELVGPRRSSAVRLVFSSADGARSRISPASDAAVGVTPGKRTVHSLQTFATNERYGHFTAKPDWVHEARRATWAALGPNSRLWGRFFKLSAGAAPG